MQRLHTKVSAIKRFCQSWFGPSEPACKRPQAKRTVQLNLEELEGRQLLSSGGTISAITNVHGQTVAYTIGTDYQVYDAYNGGGWHKLSGNNAVANFEQVSAGLDNQGKALCYAVEADNGNLWVFQGGYWNPNYVTYSWWGGLSDNNVNGYDLGGDCLHFRSTMGANRISGTRNGECYVIGEDRTIWVYNYQGGSTKLTNPPDATQLSAGVDQWGQDKVYILDGSGYMMGVNHDRSWQWLRASNGSYPRALTISAGVGTNSSGTDLYYVSAADASLHFFDGSYDIGMGGKCLSISASVDRNGWRDCYVIGTDGHLYQHNFWHWADFGEPYGHAVEYLAAANDDMVFALTDHPGNPAQREIWTFDPNNDWGMWSPWAPSAWQYTQGIAPAW